MLDKFAIQMINEIRAYIEILFVNNWKILDKDVLLLYFENLIYIDIHHFLLVQNLTMDNKL